MRMYDYDEPTFYRVYKGDDDISGEILGDFDTEEEAYKFAEEQTPPAKVMAVLSQSDYDDLYPAPPMEL